MKIIEKAIFVASDCEMYADMIAESDLIIGRLEIDNYKACGRFVTPNGLDLQIPDCRTIGFTEDGVIFWNNIGKWEFEPIS